MKIKLLICYHKPDVILKDDILTPIHVGRINAINSANANLSWMQDNMIGDETGENISHKNANYNELTAVYWAWKNYDKLGNPDYIGLMHYRRHFIFDETKRGVIDFSDMNDKGYLDAINYSKEQIERLLSKCDFIYHRGKVDNIYKHYTENHRISDLDTALSITKRLFPQYSNAVKEYIEQDYGCFCNMVILPKAMFFEYCEWLFAILEEFEKKVDISEKRLFISERLTGIFVQKKMKEGYKAMPLATSFIKAPTNIPIAMPYNPEKVFSTVVTMLSCLENSNKDTSFSFYLLSDKATTEQDLKRFDILKKKYNNLSVEIISVKNYIGDFLCDNIEKFYPLIIADLIPKVNKCFYATERVLTFKDLEEFYRTASVDDYWVLGIPDNKEMNKAVAICVYENAFMLNTDKMRKNKVWEKSVPMISKESDFISVLNVACKNQIGTFPQWFYIVSDDCDIFIDNKPNERGRLQKNALNHSFMCYENKLMPYEDIQALYSNFWWNMAASVPAVFPFIKVDEKLVVAVVEKQQIQINNSKIIKPRRLTKIKWLIKKARAYLKRHGLKKTIIKTKEHLFKK